ncbi:MAG: head-tail connector protein [Pseudomonadota bacterium]
MAAVLNSGPAVEPVSTEEVRLHLRIDHADEDDLIASLVTAARVHIEVQTGQSLITQTWSVFQDVWPNAPAVTLPLTPVISVDAVRVYSEDDTPSDIDPSHYFVDTASRPARLVLRSGRSWPRPGRAANGAEVELTAGFGANASDVPEPLRQAVLQLVAHWYENREPIVVANSAMALPHMVSALLAPYRSVHLI